MRFTTTYFALAISLTGVNADILSFSGNQCNGNRGSEVKCDNSCHSFSGRSSFKVTVSSPRCVSIYEDSNCKFEIDRISNDGFGSCSPVNTGGGAPALAYSCSPNEICV